MDYHERYKAMLGLAYGNDLVEYTDNANADAQRRQFFQSPTLSDIKLNGIEAKSIVSNYMKDSFDKMFLLEPYSKAANIGTYAEYKNKTYLIMRENDVDIYPTYYGKFCNDTFKIPTETRKVPIYGSRGIVTYKYEYVTKEVPVVVDVKGYSIADNAVLPLAEGRIIIYMQYKPEYSKMIPLNHEFVIFRDTYKVSDVQLDKVSNEIGYMVISAQKVSDNDVTTT